jgi:hypothetical protein
MQRIHLVLRMSNYVKKVSHKAKVDPYKLREEVLCSGKWVGLKRTIYYNPRREERVSLMYSMI